MEFLLKMEILVKKGNFSQNWKLSSTMEIVAKTVNFGQNANLFQI